MQHSLMTILTKVKLLIMKVYRKTKDSEIKEYYLMEFVTVV